MNRYIVHSGIKGQKWGIRRFQNKDGSLTEEGKKRYNPDKPESSTWKSSEAKYLTDAELNRRNSRLQREQQYKNMTKSNGRKAAEWIGKTAAGILVVSAIGVLKGRMAGHYKDFLDEYGGKALESVKEFSSMRFGKGKWVL